MITKQEQLNVLNAQNTLAKKTLLDIKNSISEARTDEGKIHLFGELAHFADDVVNKLIAKNGEAEQILQMWIDFNTTMEKNPHVAEKWNEFITIMTLID